MNRRPYCPACERPLSRCLCVLAKPVSLPWRLVVLQDPSEVKNAKGSVALLRACLPELTLWRSENFAEHEDLDRLLKEPALRCLLVYPGESAISVPQLQAESDERPLCFILLDGTWRKSLKLLHSHPQLQCLPRVALAPSQPGGYHIRKSPRADGLSTFEAAAHLLGEWHSDQASADSARLLDCFSSWIERELAALPAEVSSRYPVSPTQLPSRSGKSQR